MQPQNESNRGKSDASLREDVQDSRKTVRGSCERCCSRNIPIGPVKQLVCDAELAMGVEFRLLKADLDRSQTMTHLADDAV